ncbi:MAG: primosomal protein N' [Deltaproteobacteria bacterium]|nr:primosomal protein N' [Deltaproteobacteria bacterium]
MYCEVAVPLPVRGCFTYGVPAGMMKHVSPGVRVVVPFKGQRLVGYVVSVDAAVPEGLTASQVRPIFHLLEAEPVFPEDLLRFLKEAAEYYLHPLGEVLRSAAPAVEKRAGRDPHGGPPGARGDTMKARWTRVHEETYVQLAPSPPDGAAAPPKARGDKQAQILAILAARTEVSMAELRQQVKEPRAAVESLRNRGMVALERREVPDDPFFGAPVPRDAPPELNDAQRDAVEAIVGALTHRERATFMLHGITGSGKTEVYLRAMAAAQAANKGALLLLPEIALTPQLVARYRARFGDNLAVLHSGLRDNDRHAMWKKLHRGECRVAIGARSAIFAPVRDLGLVVVDEEHDASFKQDDHFRYHGRDLALLRAHRAGVVCVLGSATPSVESYHAAMEGRYRLLHLPHRATQATLPDIEIVDLKRVGPKGPTGHELLSLPLVRALGTALARKEQAILFLNRRGFAPSVRCLRCDVALECPSCSVALVLHRREGALRCHYCDFKAPFAGACITCGCTELALLGVGTEKLEHALVASFPAARIGRLDRDVASGLGAEEVLARLRRGDLDILVGTQMVTKGHDIPRVTLVGVINADAALAFPDFRATERTFQLLAQVSGRAGRRELPGRVLIQTWQPEHPVLRRARTHDFLGFYEDEVAGRQELGYPPFGRLAALKMDGPEDPKLQAQVASLDDFLRAMPEVIDGAVKVLGPAPSPIERIRGRFRMQFLLRASERPPLRRVLARVVGALDDFTRDEVRLALDVDPMNML